LHGDSGCGTALEALQWLATHVGKHGGGVRRLRDQGGIAGGSGT
jgi:hypothetical protein